MTAKELIRKNLNVPNVLTMIRLLLVPVYVALFVSGQKYAALVTFLAASLTSSPILASWWTRLPTR